jgi:hypothetical protein
MVICNSYSSTPEKPKWRVFIPTTIAMPIAAHRAIADQIMRTINRDGYWSKKQLETNQRIKSRKHHGFDMSKLTPSSLFYLPCQSEHQDGSFFIDHNGKGRTALDPYVWAVFAANHHRPTPDLAEVAANTAVQPVPPAMPPTECPKLRRMRELIAEEEVVRLAAYRQQRRAAAIEKWRCAPPERGNEAFFRLGVELRRLGFCDRDIKDTLRLEAAFARHPSQRRAQIKSIMRELRGSARRVAA